MKVVACDGPYYLLSVNDDLEAVKRDSRARARVFNSETREIGPPFNLHSILSTSHWERCAVPEATLAQWMEGVVDAYLDE